MQTWDLIQLRHGAHSPPPTAPSLPLPTAYTFKWVLKWWVVAVGVGEGVGVGGWPLCVFKAAFATNWVTKYCK